MITWRNYQAWDNPGPFPHCFAQCSAMILIWIRPLGTSSAYKVMNRARRQNWTLPFFHCFRMPFTSFYYSTARVLHALTSPVRFITILSALHGTFAAVTHDTPRTSPTWKRLLVCDQPSDCLKARCAMCTTSSWKRSLSFAPNHGVYFNSKWNRREKLMNLERYPIQVVDHCSIPICYGKSRTCKGKTLLLNLVMVHQAPRATQRLRTQHGPHRIKMIMDGLCMKTSTFWKSLPDAPYFAARYAITSHVQHIIL
jgi:hypothetical protein